MLYITTDFPQTLFKMCMLQTCPGLEQYAIVKFAEALEAMPRALAENTGVKVRIIALLSEQQTSDRFFFSFLTRIKSEENVFNCLHKEMY